MSNNKAVLYYLAHDSSHRPDVKGFCSVKYEAGIAEFYTPAKLDSLGLWVESIKKYRYGNATEMQCDMVMNAQLQWLRLQAELSNLEVVGEVTAYEKGITLDRSGWREVLRLAVEKHADGVLAANPGRVARGAGLFREAQTELQARGLELITCESTPVYETMQ